MHGHRYTWPLLLILALARPAQGEEMVPMEVMGVRAMDDISNHMVLLRTADSTLYLPIWIGESEAYAISLRLANQPPPRPLAYDLMDKILASLKARVVEVSIEDMQEEVFHGRVYLRQGTRTISLDARPSDAIALALGAGVPIKVSRAVLKRAGLTQQEVRVPRPLTLPSPPGVSTNL